MTTIKIKATYKDAIPFEVFDVDGDALDLTNYTLTPFLYTLASTPAVYLSGSDAGNITEESTTGQFTWNILNTTFPSASQDYNLRFKISSGSYESEYPVQGDDIIVNVY